MKLRWFEKNLQPAEVYRIKDMMLDDVTVLTGKTPDLAVMTTRAGKYH
jgi:hypothetical protein